MQRNFSEWCKFAYKLKVSKHDWCPEASEGLVAPAERTLYYIHGAWHFSRKCEGWEGQARRS
jgi:hypothetical protein